MSSSFYGTGIYGMSTLYASVEGLPFSPQNPAPNLDVIYNQIRASTPIGGKVMSVVVMPSSKPGWSIVSNKNGIIAILIGLLLPAVQKVREASSQEARQVQALLAQGGRAGTHAGQTETVSFVFHNITWT